MSVTARLPSLFVSHGAPTFALDPREAGALLSELGKQLPRPQAVLVMSPHWITRALSLTAAPRPPTIHDFRGFPRELYAIHYTARGHPALAKQIAASLVERFGPVELDADRGLDHGAWIPLLHLYPFADVPVMQLSLPASFEPREVLQLGEALRPFAEQGVLIIGSGSLTHNLYEIFGAGSQGDTQYVQRFVEWTREQLRARDREALIDYLQRAPNAKRAHPTPEHFLPLLFAVGAADPLFHTRVLDGGITYGVLAMESYVFGP